MTGEPIRKKGLRQRLLVPFRTRTRSASPSPQTNTASPTLPTSVLPPAISAQSRASSLSQQLSTPSQSQHPLLQATLQRLSELSKEDHAIIQSNISATPQDADEVLDQVLEAARTRQQHHTSRSRILTFNGRTFTAREKADKILQWLSRFKTAVDIAVNPDPIHAGLPWAGIRTLLEATTTDANHMASLLVGCEVALYLSNRLKAYTDFLLQLPSAQIRSNFEAALVELYTRVLRFLAHAIRLCQTSTVRRLVQTLWEEHDVADFETSCDRLAMNVEVEANNCDQVLFQQHLQRLLVEMRNFHNVQESLNRVESEINLNQLPYAEGAEFDAYGADHDMCHPQTRAKVLASIMGWIRDPDSKRIFWLNGKAGTGKSTIAYTVASRLKNHTGILPDDAQLGASFFFKRGEGDRASAVRFFPTIARQLAIKIPQLRASIAHAISTNPSVCSKLLGEQFDKLVYEPFRALSPGQSDSAAFVVVVDALDECESWKDIETILKLWPRLTQLTAIRLKLFLTGRPDPQVQQGFATMPMKPVVLQDMVLTDVPETDIREDITFYLEDQFSRMKDRHASFVPIEGDWPSQHDLHSLIDLTVPLFISAATACRFIGDSLRSDPQEQLEKFLQARGKYQLSRMEQTYLPVLVQLTANLTELEDQARVHEEFRIIVGSIVLLADPLSLHAIAKILAIPPRQVQRCLAALHSVFHVPFSFDAPIRPLHLSFREFLLSEKSQSKPYGIDRLQSHQKLLQYCILFLNSDSGLKENLCNLGHPGQLQRDVNVNIVLESLPAELRYACRFWVYHACENGSFVDDNGLVHTFLEIHFLHWLEALSLMGRLSTAVDMMQQLQSITLVRSPTIIGEHADCHKEGSQVWTFLQDARRFILANRYVIDLAPLQVYSSARTFSPRRSHVRNICGHIPHWIRLPPLVSDAWSSEIQKLEGHAGPVIAVCFSPDSRLLASASHDNTVRLWDSSTGQDVQVLVGHTGWVKAVAFSPDSRLLASASDDTTVKLWDISTGYELNTLGDAGHATTVAFSPDSKLLVSTSSHGMFSLWETSTGQEVKTVLGHTQLASAVVFSPDGKLLELASDEETIRVWDVSTGQEAQKIHEVKILLEYTDQFSSVAFSHDSRLLATASSRSETIKLWDTDTGQEAQVLGAHTVFVEEMAFSPDGKLLASASKDNTVVLWDISTGQEVKILPGHTHWVFAVAFSADGRLLASTSSDETVRLWDISIEQGAKIVAEHMDEFTAMAFSPDGKLLATVTDDMTVRLWDVSIRREFKTVLEQTDWFTAVAFSPDSRLLATASRTGMVRLWDTSTGQEIQVLVGHTDYVRAVAFSPDGKLLASASDDKTVRLWDVSTGHKAHEVQMLQGHEQWVRTVAFSPDGQLLASGSDDDTVRLWDVSTGQEVQVLVGHDRYVTAVAFSPDGKLLASASYDKTVIVWDTSVGQQAQRFSDCFTWNLTFTSDGRTLSTDRDTLHIDRALIASVPTSTPINASPVTIRKEWLQWNGHDLLWLPHEYRNSVIRMHRNTVVFGQKSGQIKILQLAAPNENYEQKAPLRCADE